MLALADRCGLHSLVADTLTLSGPGSANADLKVPALVAAMIAGADSIDDMDLLRHGGMGRVFGGIRAPSTLGTFLRTFTFGHVRQLDAVAARLLINLADHTPLLPDAETVTFVDIDDTVKRTYGYAKQGAGYGYSGVKGLNALIGAVSTPTSAPVIAATRLRKGSTNSARGAARLVADTLSVAKNCGASGLVLARMDSAFYNADVVAAVGRAGAKFSITARMDKAVRAAIASIDEGVWRPIKYPEAIWDDDEQRWVSDAEVAEIGYTAFTSRRQDQHVTGRLIVRRVKRLNPASGQQGELFTAYRYHAVFTNSALELIQAEATHRGHAIIEQVIADLKDGPLAHLPSGKVRRQRHLAGERRDLVQPDPRRRLPGLGLPRSRQDRDHPDPPDRRPRTDRPLGTPDGPAPADRLALGAGLAAALHRGQRPTPTHAGRLTTSPKRARPRNPKWKSRTQRRIAHAHSLHAQENHESPPSRNRHGGSRLNSRDRPTGPGMGSGPVVRRASTFTDTSPPTFPGALSTFWPPRRNEIEVQS